MPKAQRKLRFTNLTSPWQRFRSQTGISQVQLAKLLELSQPAISKYERGALPEPGIAKRFVALSRRYKVRMSLEELYADLPN